MKIIYQIAGVMFLLFLSLKLAELGVVKDWSWWKVTSPLWIALIVYLRWLPVGAILAVYYRVYPEKHKEFLLVKEKMARYDEYKKYNP